MTTEIKFPQRRDDGSFCIEISIPVSTGDPEKLRVRIQTWANDWVETNQTWKRNWLSDNEELRYDEEFNGPPRATFAAPHELRIRLEGQPSAKWWKDWMVYRILNDLRSAFEEIRDTGPIRNCD